MGKSFSLEKLFVCTLFLIALTDQGSTRASSRQSSIGEEASDDGGSYGGRELSQTITWPIEVVHELKQTQQERNNNSELSEKRQEQMQGNETNFGFLSSQKGLDDKEVKALPKLISGLRINNSYVDVNASFCTNYVESKFANFNSILFTLPGFAPYATFGCSDDKAHITYISLIGSGNTVENETEGGNVGTAAPPYLLHDISTFTQLKTLYIVNIPLTVSALLNLLSLNKLKKLVLQKNGLAGSIPSNLKILKNLTYLDLSYNNLEGPIPPTLGNLTMLTTLDLSTNQLTGEIPDNFKKLSNLEQLLLSENFIHGSASFLCNLSSLVTLDLSQNNFSGEIPPSLGKLVSLQYLNLDTNLFSGKIPEELGNLTKLAYITIKGNNLSGKLPDISNLTQVQVFTIGGNNLTGRIPDYIARWKNLYYLSLLGNRFTSIPDGIFNLPNLIALRINNVQITSPFKIPVNASLPNLISLILRNCSIGGDIPEFIGNWTYLTYLDLSFNQLEGEIPDSLNHTSLTDLYLTGNKLNGSIPDWINKKLEKNKTDLSFNNFIEQDPNHNEQEMNLTNLPINFINKLTIQNLSKELCKNRASHRKSAINSGGAEVKYEGTFYEADESVAQYNVSKSKNWAYICSGGFIPGGYNSSAYIKNLTCSADIHDEPLHKSARFCPGELTYYGFCFAKGSYTVKLYFAEIVYTNTFDYSILNRRIFDVYVQDKRILQDFNIKDIAGGPNKPFIYTYKDAKVKGKDDNLLKIRFVWKGKGTISGDAFNGPLISAISVTPKYPLTKIQTAAVTFVIIIALVLVFAFLWRTGMIGDRNTRRKVIKLHDKPYSFKQLLDATRNFSDKKVIGKGYFGKVYKADFPNPDQKVYVVKKLHPEFLEKQGGQLRQEFFTLQRLDHKNIVPVLDGYWKGDLTLLIYEYMEGGSLETALFDESSVSILRNNWEARLIVCKDIVKGLKYLHEDSTFQITHGDIKANNVLLDGSDPPTTKLSDFGLAKFYEEENPFSVTKDKRQMQLIAPGQVSTIPTVKADVYSFGMLLLEIISGKRAFEINEDEAEFLLPKATQLFRDHKAEELVDSKLRIEDRKQAASLVELALKCVDVVPDRRPTMSQVLAALESL